MDQCMFEILLIGFMGVSERFYVDKIVCKVNFAKSISSSVFECRFYFMHVQLCMLEILSWIQ